MNADSFLLSLCEPRARVSEEDTRGFPAYSLLWNPPPETSYHQAIGVGFCLSGPVHLQRPTPRRRQAQSRLPPWVFLGPFIETQQILSGAPSSCVDAASPPSATPWYFPECLVQHRKCGPAARLPLRNPISGEDSEGGALSGRGAATVVQQRLSCERMALLSIVLQPSCHFLQEVLSDYYCCPQAKNPANSRTSSDIGRSPERPWRNQKHKTALCLQRPCEDGGQLCREATRTSVLRPQQTRGGADPQEARDSEVERMQTKPKGH